MLLILSSILSYGLNARSNSLIDQTVPSYEKILVQCTVPQGNGGNWASTLGWLSEELMMKSEYAKQLELKSNKPIGIYLDCMIGGSSASIATVVLMEVLNNKNLFPKARKDRIFSAKDLEVIAKSLRVLSYTLDYSFKDRTRLFGHMLNTLIVRNSLEVLKSWFLHRDHPKWWQFYLTDSDVLLNFIKENLQYARNIPRSLLNLPTHSFLKEKYAMRAKQYGAYSAGDLFIGQGPEIHQALEKKALKQVKKTSKHFARALRKKAKYYGDADNHNKLKQKDDALDILSSPLSDGYCSIVMVQFMHSDFGDRWPKKGRYKNLRPMILCNKKTATSILNSSLYQKHVQEENQHTLRFIVGSVESIRPALSLSIREPLLTRLLVGPLNGSNIEISSYYDPFEDIKAGRRPRFKLNHLDQINKQLKAYQINKHAKAPKIAVVGAFLDRRISAWMMSYYYLELFKKLSKDSAQVEGSVSLFGMPDQSLDQKFDHKVIRDYFSRQKKAGENYEDWLNFQRTWCETFSPIFQDHSARITTVALNYNLYKVPAALNRTSHNLFVKSANATRAQLSQMIPLRKKKIWYFDPSLKLDKNTGNYDTSIRACYTAKSGL